MVTPMSGHAGILATKRGGPRHPIIYVKQKWKQNSPPPFSLILAGDCAGRVFRGLEIAGTSDRMILA